MHDARMQLQTQLFPICMRCVVGSCALRYRHADPPDHNGAEDPATVASEVAAASCRPPVAVALLHCCQVCLPADGLQVLAASLMCVAMCVLLILLLALSVF